MGKALVESFPLAMDIFELADSMLGFSISTICFEGPEAELRDPANAQLAIFVTSLAAYRVLRQFLDERFQLAALAGHSLGEYSALVVSGALDFEDALRVVRARGQAMRLAGERVPGGMLAVLRASRDQVEELCKETSQETGKVVQVANDNCPGQIVVAGEHRALDLFMQKCKTHGISKPVALNVAVAPHTSLMTEALPAFLPTLSSISIKRPNVPVVGNVSANWLTTRDEVQEELTEQLTRPVLWNDSMRLLVRMGVKTTVEIGPGKVLTGLMRRVDRQIKRANFGNEPSELTRVLGLLQES